MLKRDPLDWMWLQAIEMLEKAERFNRLFFQIQHSRARLPAWEPPVDIVETLDELHITAVLPGVCAEQVEVLIEGGMVRIAGERPPPVMPSTTQIHRLEIPFGRFERRIHLPPGRYKLIHSEYQRGCLRLSFHKVT